MEKKGTVAKAAAVGLSTGAKVAIVGAAAAAIIAGVAVAAKSASKPSGPATAGVSPTHFVMTISG
jgi:hypothetical protein